jgi:uncharacterized membrane protein YraQ (UPF0718 family)
VSTFSVAIKITFFQPFVSLFHIFPILQFTVSFTGSNRGSFTGSYLAYFLNLIFPMSSCCIMAVLRLRYFSSFVFKVSISLSMLERTFAMAICSSFEDGYMIIFFPSYQKVQNQNIFVY